MICKQRSPAPLLRNLPHRPRGIAFPAGSEAPALPIVRRQQACILAHITGSKLRRKNKSQSGGRHSRESVATQNSPAFQA